MVVIIQRLYTNHVQRLMVTMAFSSLQNSRRVRFHFSDGSRENHRHLTGNPLAGRSGHSKCETPVATVLAFDSAFAEVSGEPNAFVKRPSVAEFDWEHERSFACSFLLASIAGVT